MKIHPNSTVKQILLAYLPLALMETCLLISRVRAADDLTQQLRVSPDGHFLMQPDGSPFFWQADTAWELFFRLTREEAEIYLTDRASKGFNLVQAVAFGGPSVLYTNPNCYGDIPLIEGDPTRPNPKYFEHIDWVVNCAARHGIRIGLLPVWGGNVIGGYGPTPARLFTPEKAEIYGRWLGERYRNKGVVWILGGDTNPVGATESSAESGHRDLTLIDYRPIYDAMAKGIIAGERGKPAITYHLTCGNWLGSAKPLTSEFFSDRDWFTLNMLQSSHFQDPNVVVRPNGMGLSFAWDGTRNYEPVRMEYDSLPIRPVIDGEPRYEDLYVDVERDPKITAVKGFWKAYDARNAAYHSVFSGAAGHTFGNASIWMFYDPARQKSTETRGLPWREALNQPGAGQMQYLKALMLSRPYFTRIPDQSMLVGDSGEGERHVSATRSKDGSCAMVYLPKGQAVTVDLGKISGLSAAAWWFDPRSGAAKRIDGSFAANQTGKFTPPTSGSENDWVLIIDDASKHFSSPGGSD